MKAARWSTALGAALGLAMATAAAADTKQQVELGAKEFRAKCAACHGVGGKGDGPQAASLS